MLHMKPAPKPHAIFAYVHHNQRFGAMVTLTCQTDFALRTDLLQDFGNKLAKHLVATDGREHEDFAWTFDPAKKVKDVMAELSAALGEEVEMTHFSFHTALSSSTSLDRTLDAAL